MQPLRMSFLSKFHFKADIVYFVFVKNYFSFSFFSGGFLAPCNFSLFSWALPFLVINSYLSKKKKNYFSYLNFVFSVLSMFFKKKKLETKSVIYVFIVLLE